MHKKLGYSYIYHYNEFTDTWFCIPRDEYLNFWQPDAKGNWTSGSTLAQAQTKMLAKTK